MFEGFFFQFPKLGFLLFFFLACEALCPLRSNALYYPNTVRFGEVGVKPALWMWIAKWAMITFFIVALMSPVKEKEIAYSGGGGYDILLIVDPKIIDTALIAHLSVLIDERVGDAIGLWVPAESEVAVPLTYEHDALKSILSQIGRDDQNGDVTDTHIRRFFNASAEARKWIIMVTNAPNAFVRSLPIEINVSVSPPKVTQGWMDAIHRDHPGVKRFHAHRYVDYYYIYPLFLGFMAMLVYLYGRNQKGLK